MCTRHTIHAERIFIPIQYFQHICCGDWACVHYTPMNDERVTELINLDENLRIASRLRICETTGERLRGLLGISHLDDNQAVWIQRCNSIHTFFMQMTIDVAFLDDQLRIVKLISKMTPWRICLPVLRATSIVEGPVGMIPRGKLKRGSQLQVISG